MQGAVLLASWLRSHASCVEPAAAPTKSPLAVLHELPSPQLFKEKMRQVPPASVYV